MKSHSLWLLPYGYCTLTEPHLLRVRTHTHLQCTHTSDLCGRYEVNSPPHTHTCTLMHTVAFNSPSVRWGPVRPPWLLGLYDPPHTHLRGKNQKIKMWVNERVAFFSSPVHRWTSKSSPQLAFSSMSLTWGSNAKFNHFTLWMTPPTTMNSSPLFSYLRASVG